MFIYITINKSRNLKKGEIDKQTNIYLFPNFGNLNRFCGFWQKFDVSRKKYW